ncbi:hypothetical protein [Lyngbya sp. PCC 8106]|uniref:hypothetical protein n=1 Tax=Lyngbya sp. (strain PCC 8106) TaxID=313612 RepID=UPI0000EADB12|nr:hypothetical protein [Lyngbya sp. PCC 8106]EAW36425.1 hypothetical protein L8106_23890 [Lyngbya sp. PCC 8106]
MNQNLLKQAINRDNVFKKLLQTELNQGANANHLAFLDRGIENSPYRNEIDHYPTYLLQKSMTFRPYPQLGKIPEINPDALLFLHEEITEACICLGRWEQEKLQTLWMGKNSLRKAQFWSSTKIIAILNVLSQVNSRFPYSAVENWQIQNPEDECMKASFDAIVEDIVSYEKQIASSNALSAMFKRFETREKLEKWLQNITGNYDLEFQGDYGESPWMMNPELVDCKRQEVLLKAVSETEKGENLLSAYDLTRIISMVGWHYYLDPSLQIPGVNWNSLQPIIRGLGKDTARFVDVALEMLGLENVIRFPVILSKLGHGPSSLRQTIETTYMAFVQFVDPLPKATGNSAKLRSIAMTLRGVIPIQDMENFDDESIRLDARIAAEVTEILRRVITEELDEVV